MITDEQIVDGCNKAYLKAGNNTYYSNGFEAGVRFALEQVKNLSSKPDVIKSVCNHRNEAKFCDSEGVNRYVKCGEKVR